MKVILKEDVKALGKKGKVCEVSDGYARNFLIPRGLAVEATQGNVQDLVHKQKQEELRKQKEKQAALDLSQRIENMDIIVKVKVGEKGRLFGSVTNKEIAEVLEKEYQLKLDKRKIEVKEPIKGLGEYQVTVKLHFEVTANLKIKIEAQ
ncbi:MULTISPECIES: 50S ribosomal protein L9 [Dehalobacter]|uniref:Large ribosomal subunit protein bL9 n=2 Tax=Dehalobacter restrictus TaxID=55583 RepID=A0A857DM53_9FIRM|nr:MULTISPECIES: 50S ribosomal protein L9 [Dehalobacter]AHF11159.1 50S ribosomal protein L9 [Dehalobacter restrictus DSM 9455]MCG1024214.1 50S ribosomal protein L9 [Dehalobacter sp.]MDJ0305303.1 50S ribosomal protein L9 [Dehalobacter sp.]OCZ49789.1 50S ribosomal protein L9 [Dehalobacter sp. TeCB1]QHA01801.1 50S ribosomal protein L9 [Dehalobacter restrictus]